MSTISPTLVRALNRESSRIPLYCNNHVACYVKICSELLFGRAALLDIIKISVCWANLLLSGGGTLTAAVAVESSSLPFILLELQVAAATVPK